MQPRSINSFGGIVSGFGNAIQQEKALLVIESLSTTLGCLDSFSKGIIRGCLAL